MLIDGAQFCSTKQNIDTSATYKIKLEKTENMESDSRTWRMNKYNR